MATIGNLWINVKSNTSGLGKGLGKARGMLGKFGKFAASPAGIAVAAFAALTAGVLLAGKAIMSATREFMKFEAGMAEVKSVMLGLDPTKMQEMTDEAKRLGATTAFTAEEAAQGMAMLARAGFTAAENITALPSVLDLASASGMGLAEAADIMATGMSGFGLEADQAAHFADVLAVGANSANTTVAEMGEAFQHVAPIAKQLGFSVEETSAMIAHLQDSGIKGGKAGTALRVVFAELGGEIEKNGTGALKKYLKEGHNFTENLEKFGKLGVNAVGILQGMTDKTASLTTNMEEATGVVNEMAEARLDTLAGDMTYFESAVSGLKTEIGEKLAPTFRAIVQVATKFVGGLQAAFSSVFEGVEGSIVSTETLMSVFKVMGGIIFWIIGIAVTMYNRFMFGFNAIKMLGAATLTTFSGFVQALVEVVAWGMNAVNLMSDETYDSTVGFMRDLTTELAKTTADAAVEMGGNFMQGWAGGAAEDADKLNKVFEDSMDGIKDHGKVAGKQVAEQLAEGLEEGTPAVVAAVEKLTDVQMELVTEGTKLSDKLQEQITYFGMSAAEILNAKAAETDLTSATVMQTLALEKQLEGLKAEQVAMEASKQAAQDAIALAESKADAMQSAADRIIESLRTPQEVYDSEVDKLRKMMDENLLTLEQFEGAVNKLNKKDMEVKIKKKEEIEVHIESKGFVEGLSTAMGSIKIAGQVNKAEQIAEKSVDIQTKIQSVMDAVKSNTEQNLEAVESVQQETAAVASTLSTDVNGVETMLGTVDTSINNISNSSQMDATEQLLGTSNDLSNNQLTQLQNINQNLLAMNSGGSLT